MKTTANHNRTSKMVTALCAAFVFATGTWAQPDPEANRNNVEESFSRMETLIAHTKEAVKYAAPSVNDQDEISAAFERLEMLASNIEEVIRYRVPDEEQNNAVEYASKDKDQENDADSNADAKEFLTYNSANAGSR
jgi:hypothetical protein